MIIRNNFSFYLVWTKSRKSSIALPPATAWQTVKVFTLKFFYVMGKVLSGELSCPCERSCFSLKPYVVNPHLNRVVETLTVQKKNVEFHSEKPVEVAHNEPLHLDLHCLLASP